MATKRDEMNKMMRQMLVNEGVYDLYKDQLEEIAFALSRWRKDVGSFKDWVHALANKTEALQNLLTEAKTLMTNSPNGHCVIMPDE